MADIEAEIARLQAEIEKRRYEVESFRQEQPVWDDKDADAADDGSEYSEESYYEEEIIEEYSDDEWEEEIIEEEILEEEVIEDDDDETLQNVAPNISTPVVNNQFQTTPSYRAAQSQSQNTASVPSTEPSVPPPPTNTAAAVPLTTPRKWTPSYARTTTATAPEPVKTETAPTAPKWKRPTQVTPPPPPPQQSASSSLPAWATKQQSKIKKTAVPIISSSNSTPAQSTPVIRAPSAPAPAAVGPPVTRTKAKVRAPPGANGQPVVKNAPPPGLEEDAKTKGPRIKIINWGANRRTNTAIQSETRPNFKPSVPGTTTPAEADKVKRNYVIPKDIKKPVGPDGGATVTPPTGGHKRRPIPDVPVSPPGEETLWEQLLGPKLIANSKLQKKNTTGCMKDQELIGLYFGCKMKPECKYFHPRLQDFYFSAAARQQNFEIVYVSSDRTLNDFKELFAKMPYLALPGGTASYKNKLSQSLKIIDQPTLVILDDEGMVVTVDAVQQILQLEKNNIDQANALIDRWKRTRPVTMEQIQRDYTLQDGKQQRGILYWQE